MRVMACAQTPAPTQLIPSLTNLRASIDAASGKAPDSSEEFVDAQVDTDVTHETIVRSGKDYVEIDKIGTLEQDSGEVGGQRWRQNLNGETVLAQPDSGGAVDDKATTKITHVTVPFDAFVIETKRGIDDTREYVDTSTYRILRTERATPSAIFTTVFDDFQTTNGYTFARHWVESTGNRKAEFTVTSYVSRPVIAAELAIPPTRRHLVEFPDGKNNVPLPVRLINDSFVVRVTIAGRAMDFLIDSGASGMFIQDNIAHDLNPKPVTTSVNGANAGGFASSVVLVPDVSVGDLQMHNAVFATIPHLGFDTRSTSIVGLLGFDFIADVALGLDYEHAKAVALNVDAPIRVADPNAITLDVRLGSELAETAVKVNGETGDRFAIDTGAGTGLVMFDHYARLHTRALVDVEGAEMRGEMRGVGGMIPVSVYRLADVQIGRQEFRGFIGSRATDTRQYNVGLDGLVGSDFLRLYTVWFDYANSHVILQRNGRNM